MQANTKNILIVILLLLSYSQAISKSFHKKDIIYHSIIENDRELIDLLDQNVRKEIPRIESQLGAKLNPTIQIYLTHSKSEFFKLTRGRAPRWAGGIAFTNKKVIIVKSPDFFGQGVPLHVLTLHEITHLLIHDATRGNYLPKWINEGLCTVLSGETRSGSLGILGRAAMADRLIGLPRVDRVLSFSSPDADLAYVQARSAVAYMTDRHGWDAVKILLQKIKKGMDFEQAFFEAIGVEYELWLMEWMDWARNRYKWTFLLDIDSLIWIVIVLFGSTIVIIVYLRKRRQLKDMLDEDDDDSDGDRGSDPFEWDTPYKK